MQVKSMPQAILKAGVDILSPFVPELTAPGLVRALKEFNAGTRAPVEAWWTTRQTAAFLSETHWSTIRKLKTGLLKGKRVGGKWLVDPASVRGLLGIGEDADCHEQTETYARDGRPRE